MQCPLCGQQFKLSKDQSALEESAAGGTAFVFRQEGEFWFIGYEEDAFLLKDTKGLRYLHILLGNPAREILALDLVQHDEGGFAPRSNAPRLQRDDGLRLFMPGDGGEVIDRSARLAYEQRVRDLADEIEDAEALGDAGRGRTLERGVGLHRGASGRGHGAPRRYSAQRLACGAGTPVSDEGHEIGGAPNQRPQPSIGTPHSEHDTNRYLLHLST